MKSSHSHSETPPVFAPLTAEFTPLSAPEAARYRQHLAQRRQLLALSGTRQRLQTLIVEDQAFSRNLLYEMLHHSCSVITSANVADGWKYYVEAAPDIAFIDIGLPGTEGHALADRIKEVDTASYVVMVTGSQDIYDIQSAKINRVDGFIVKPFSKKKIGDCINRYLATHKKTQKFRIQL